MAILPGFALGVYEKALPAADWRTRLSVASDLGFDYVEMSIDPGEIRLSRLDWSPTQRREIRRVMEDTGIHIRSICLSAHREHPLGSGISARRDLGLEIARKAIYLASDLGIRIIQIAGYDTLANELSDEKSHERYMDALRTIVGWASERSILLGIENQEAAHVCSPSTAIDIISQLNSPYLRLYLDVGNLIVNQCDVKQEIAVSTGHLVGVHVKDARPGQPRRVPFGCGDVPFEDIFRQLLETGYRGPVTIEMWNEDLPNAIEVCSQAREWLIQQLLAAIRSTQSLVCTPSPFSN